jgi:hypothetical protein
VGSTRDTARMTGPHVTVRETVVVRRPPGDVWDYTQDYANRTAWDQGVRAVDVLDADPRRVRVDLQGTGSATLEYQLDRRPERTSLRMVDVVSRWIAGGGGSWEYSPVPGGTAWTQTNTLVLRHRRLGRLLAPLVERSLRANTRTAMRRAKGILEAR